MKYDTRTLFMIKRDLTRTENLINLVQNRNGFSYKEAFLIDLKSFKLDFLIMFSAVKNQITKNGLEPLPKKHMLKHYQNTRAEFKNEIRLIKNKL